ncbi:unnamed protein product [Lymnaea stagnalis]|uniref:Uncharacterized protein n=1 Tax=Lymnaea stagnalis TaxID=6523 RepID=A0AAV2H829_LYMST
MPTLQQEIMAIQPKQCIQQCQVTKVKYVTSSRTHKSSMLRREGETQQTEPRNVVFWAVVWRYCVVPCRTSQRWAVVWRCCLVLSCGAVVLCPAELVKDS